MKLSSFRYLVKEGFKNTWVNRLMTVASVGVLVACMVIIGLAVMISQNINMAMGNLEKQNVIMAYMKDYSWALYGEGADKNVKSKDKADENGIRRSDYVIHNEKEAKALCDEIAKIDNVASVTFISSEEGLKTATGSMTKTQKKYFNFLDGKKENPLPCAAKIAMADMTLFDSTIAEIEKLPGIDTIQSNSGLAEKLSAIENGIAVAGVWIIAILMIISLVIVSNTIRVTMYTRKLEISIMKAVGATDTFVRLPFVVEGMVIGIISALIAEGLLYCCYRIATETIIKTFGGVIPFSQMSVMLLLMFLGIGILSGVIGSLIMISKYLRKEGSEFAAI